LCTNCYKDAAIIAQQFLGTKATRHSLCGCWTTCMEQFTSVHHWLLVTSPLQEIPQDLLIYPILLQHESDFWLQKVPL